MASPEISSVYSLSADGKKALYISAEKQDKNKWPRYDLYLKELKSQWKWPWENKEPVRLTENLSVLYADLSRDGKSVALVKKHHAKDFLGVLDVESKTVRYIFPSKNPQKSETDGEYNIYTPRFSPDGGQIVFSYWDGKNRQIGLIDTAGKIFYTFFKSGFDDRDPAFSPDGEWVIFSSDRTGVFNLYKKNIHTGALLRISNVSGGAFHGEMSPDGKKIAYVNFDKNGFSLYLMPDTVLEEIKVPTLFPDKSVDTLPPLIVSRPSSPYHSFPRQFLFSPMIIGEEVISGNKEATQGISRWFAGGVMNLMDPLSKNFIGAMILLQINEGFNFISPKFNNLVNPGIDKEFSLVYENKMFIPTLGAEFNLRTIHDKDRFWNEDLRDTSQLDYEISLMDIGATTRYQLTPSQKFHVLGNYFTSGNNFYNLDYFPEFSYLKGWRAGAMWTFLQEGRGSARDIAPKGIYAKIKADHWENELIKEGSFSEAFSVQSGHIVANMNSYPFNMVKASLKYGMPNPMYSKHVLGLQATGTVIDRPVHSYFEVGPFLKGYPFLKNKDSLFIAGNKAFQIEADYYFPIVKEINKTISFLYFNQAYGLAFFEAGGAWNHSLEEMKNISKNDLFKSVGAELRLECVSQSSYPFATYLRAVYGMDNPIQNERTRYQFGISFSFDNWGLIDIPDYLSRGLYATH
jgi:hypothetical protein